MSHLKIKDNFIQTSANDKNEIKLADGTITASVNLSGAKKNVIEANASTITFGKDNDDFTMTVANISAKVVTVTKVQENATTTTSLSVGDKFNISGAGVAIYNADAAAKTLTDTGEVARLKDVNASVNVEKTRAMGIEANLQSSIDAETTLARAAESALSASVSGEKTRAMGIEANLQSSIDAETTLARGYELDILKYVNEFMVGTNIATDFKSVKITATEFDTDTVTVRSMAATVIAAQTLSSYSDARLKKDVENVLDATAKVNALRPVFYNWNDRVPLNPGHKEIGFIAQEVEEVLPNIVRTLDDEMKTKTVAYDRLVSLLVAALKEQDVRISALEAKSA
jgi:hypothetical protein